MYVYSAKNNMFYPKEMQSVYENAGSWPTDGVEVDESIFSEFTTQPPTGKTRIAGPEGLPVWANIPEPTSPQLIQLAERQKADLLNQANNTTADWRTELALGIISDDDKESLIAWMKYIKAVKSVNTSSAPTISWPVKPAS